MNKIAFRKHYFEYYLAYLGFVHTFVMDYLKYRIALQINKWLPKKCLPSKIPGWLSCDVTMARHLGFSILPPDSGYNSGYERRYEIAKREQREGIGTATTICCPNDCICKSKMANEEESGYRWLNQYERTWYVLFQSIMLNISRYLCFLIVQLIVN